MSEQRGDEAVLVDLAARSFGGAVVWANDESFAARENLVTDAPPTFTPRTFGAKGQVYDGWETRRRRDRDGRGPDARDEAIVRLGAPGVVREVVVDTSHFTGNYPVTAAVAAACVGGHPPVGQLRDASWTTIVARTPLAGDAQQTFPVDSRRRWTHVRLGIYPDGGVARLRVRGHVVADPRVLAALGTIDLAAAEHGAVVTGCSNLFYGEPQRLLAAGPARSMGEGWETARRRDDDNDWVQVRLVTRGVIRVVELDTSWFLFNAPGEAALVGRDGPGAPWQPLVERRELQPDTRHRVVVDSAAPVTEVRLDAYPDGGMARLRLWGTPTEDGLAALSDRWAETGA